MVVGQNSRVLQQAQLFHDFVDLSLIPNDSPAEDDRELAADILVFHTPARCPFVFQIGGHGTVCQQALPRLGMVNGICPEARKACVFRP